MFFKHNQTKRCKKKNDLVKQRFNEKTILVKQRVGERQFQ